jgi:hypothetical protein
MAHPPARRPPSALDLADHAGPTPANARTGAAAGFAEEVLRAYAYQCALGGLMRRAGPVDGLAGKPSLTPRPGHRQLTSDTSLGVTCGPSSTITANPHDGPTYLIFRSDQPQKSHSPPASPAPGRVAVRRGCAMPFGFGAGGLRYDSVRPRRWRSASARAVSLIRPTMAWRPSGVNSANARSWALVMPLPRIRASIST